MTATRELFEAAFCVTRTRHTRHCGPRSRYARSTARDGTVWLLTRYADVRPALADPDPRLSEDRRWTLPPEQRADVPLRSR